MCSDQLYLLIQRLKNSTDHHDYQYSNDHRDYQYSNDHHDYQYSMIITIINTPILSHRFCSWFYILYSSLPPTPTHTLPGMPIPHAPPAPAPANFGLSHKKRTPKPSQSLKSFNWAKLQEVSPSSGPRLLPPYPRGEPEMGGARSLNKSPP